MKPKIDFISAFSARCPRCRLLLTTQQFLVGRLYIRGDYSSLSAASDDNYVSVISGITLILTPHSRSAPLSSIVTLCGIYANLRPFLERLSPFLTIFKLFWIFVWYFDWNLLDSMGNSWYFFKFFLNLLNFLETFSIF